MPSHHPETDFRARTEHDNNNIPGGLKHLKSLALPLSGTRNIVDVIFSYTNRNTDVTEKFSVSVDVTGKFPYLVKKLSPYYNRY